MVAAAMIGSSVVGGIMQSDAAGKAATTQAGAADRATAATERQMQQNRTDTAPYREAGYEALAQQRTGMQVGGDFNRDFTLADFAKDPGYQFRMDEGTRAVEGSAAARGGLLSGATLKGLTQYGQNFASSEYGTAYQRFNADRDRRFNRLATVAGNGLNAVNGTAAMGTAATESMNQSSMAGADARAAGTMGSANAVSGALTNGANGYMSLAMMNRMYPQTPAAASPSYVTPTAGPSTVMSGNFIPAA